MDQILAVTGPAVLQAVVDPFDRLCPARSRRSRLCTLPNPCAEERNRRKIALTELTGSKSASWFKKKYLRLSNEQDQRQKQKREQKQESCNCNRKFKIERSNLAIGNENSAKLQRAGAIPGPQANLLAGAVLHLLVTNSEALNIFYRGKYAERRIKRAVYR